MRLRDDGKWRVYQGHYSLTWLAVNGGEIHRFASHAEALAYAVQRAYGATGQAGAAELPFVVPVQHPALLVEAAVWRLPS